MNKVGRVSTSCSILHSTENVIEPQLSNHKMLVGRDAPRSAPQSECFYLDYLFLAGGFHFFSFFFLFFLFRLGLFVLCFGFSFPAIF